MTKSLLDIQAEQEHEKSNPHQRSNSNNNNNNNRPINSRSRGMSPNNANNNNHRSNSGGGGGGGYNNNRDGGGGGGYNNNSNNRDNRGPRGGGRGRGGDRNKTNIDPSRLPLEQGTVVTLKDKFGFIRCADRDEEVFFHFSQVVDNVALNRDDPVEFRVNAQQPEKLSAMQVRKLDTPIVWEVEDEPDKRYRGLVERATRFDRGNNIDGTIRMLVEKTCHITQGEDGATEEDIIVDAPEGPLLRFTNVDYQPVAEESTGPNNTQNNNSFTSFRPASGSNSRHPNRLSRGDLVEFSMFTTRRTKEKFARGVTLLLSERERQRQEQERKLLEVATEEHGVVTALKGEYGFLRSNKRREEVYFHYSAIHVEGEQQGDSEVVLKEGQEMKFLVVDEGLHDDPGANSKRRISARQVQMQPAGTVKFHDALACGVTGIVIQTPQPIDAGHNLEHRGKIRLHEPVIDSDGDGNERLIEEVYLSTKDSPGGTFAFRGGSSIACWVQEGDILLFDVIRDFVDGACHAEPTKHLVPNFHPYELEIEDDEHDPPRRVRLIKLALIARADGFVNAVKESYGFIHFSERPVDVHFKLYQLLPDELQKDLRRNMGLKDVDSKGKPLTLSIGAEVQFDISVHGTIHTAVAGKNHRGPKQQVQPHERENLKAQRVLLVPPGTIVQNKVLAKGVRGVVTKEDPKQPYAGTVDLDEAVKAMTPEERHPHVSDMLTTYMRSEKQGPIIFHDVQSRKEEETIIELVDRVGKEKLTWAHLPDDHHEQNHAGKLCITKKGVIIDDDVVVDEETHTTHLITESHDDGHKSFTTDGTESDLHDTDDEHDLHSDTEDDPEKARKRALKKKKKMLKPFKSIRFDKSNLTKEQKTENPPLVGDIVELDVVQSRRSGQVAVENMRVVERAAPDPNRKAEPSVNLGIVKDVVPGRNFGFISIFDETAENQELLFFSFSSVVSSSPNNSGSKKKTAPIKKGDEVKFEFGTEKSGKRVALNVTVVTKGTIPNTAEKNACRGFILLQPSHTSFDKSSVGRNKSNEKLSGWSSSEEKSENSVKDMGCILLLEDPADVFGGHSRTSSMGSKSDSGETESKSSEGDISCRLNKLHLHYSNGAIAMQGQGAPTRGDLVSFAKIKSGKGSVRDVRIVSRGAATLIRGRLEKLEITGDPEKPGKAQFVAETKGKETYEIDFSEIVGCEPSVLKEKESVEGVLHNGSIYGICRTVDLYLESKVDRTNKERPKLNLTVKKDRGGKILAQSMMAKGPDGTIGFVAGWTTRMSKFAGQQGEFHLAI